MDAATLYMLILCSTSTVALCPANEDQQEQYTLTRETCLAKMRRAKVMMPDYEAFCVQFGGKEIIDSEGRINDLSHSKTYVGPPAGYTGIESDPRLLEEALRERR